MMLKDHAIKVADRDVCRRPAWRRRVVRYVCAVPVIAFAALIGGFVWFAFHIADRESRLDRAADGIVALTGGPSRITDAVELLASGRGRRLLISGVNPSTTPGELIKLTPEL